VVVEAEVREQMVGMPIMEMAAVHKRLALEV
jgi:hypothetical protein